MGRTNNRPGCGSNSRGRSNPSGRGLRLTRPSRVCKSKGVASALMTVSLSAEATGNPTMAASDQVSADVEVFFDRLLTRLAEFQMMALAEEEV